MNVLQYGDWKINVDIEKTKQYYENYHIQDTQANRNFAEYCKSLGEEEVEFFSSLGINPLCCEIEHFGVSKKGDFPCGGYYFICGCYLDYPPEDLMTVEEFIDNNFEDDRPDPRVDIGVFQFDFQCADYEIKDIPENMPEGFICIRFWCQEMKWLLNERCKEMMYEPPRFWEVHRIMREKIQAKKQMKEDFEETKRQFTDVFEKLNIQAYPLDTKIFNYKKRWLDVFAPVGTDRKELNKLCLRTRRYTTYLWHIFSYEILNCHEEDKADQLFDAENKTSCVLLNNLDELAFRLEHADNLNADALKEFIDVTVTAADFSWTYCKTHEESCGPYFYKKS